MTPDRRRLSRAESDRLLDLGTGADPLAALLASAAASHHDQPAPGEDEAMAHFRAARAARATKAAIAVRTGRGIEVAGAQAETPRRRHGLKVATSALVLTLTGGVAVAATGSLPASLQHAAHNAFGAPDAKSHGHSAAVGLASTAAATQASAHGNSKASEHLTPNATPSPSLHGLCIAYRNGVTSNPKVLENPAFSALIAAAGGLERVADFCDRLVPTKSGEAPPNPTHPARPTSTSAHPTPPTTPPNKPKDKG